MQIKAILLTTSKRIADCTVQTKNGIALDKIKSYVQFLFYNTKSFFSFVLFVAL